MTVTATLANNKKEDSKNQKGNLALNHKKLGLYKASSQIFGISSPTSALSLSTKNSIVETEYFKEKITEKNKDEKPENNGLDGKYISLTVEARLPPKSGFIKKDSRRALYVQNQYKDAHQREPERKNKSVRRNRTERMKSAHSSNRTKDQKDEKKPTKPKNFGMKYTTSRVMPKICGSTGSFKTKPINPNRTKIMGMINKIDCYEQDNISTNKITIKKDNHGCYQQNYGPLLNKMPDVNKSSFIETNNSKLQMEVNDSISVPHEIDTRNKLNQPTSSSNYNNGSGLSGQHTTISEGKTIDQDRIQKLEQGAKDYLDSLNNANQNPSKNQINDKLKRGKSCDTRRGRQSRNMERKQNETSLVNTEGQSVNSKNIDSQVFNAYDTQNKDTTLNHNSSRNFEK